MLTPTTSSFSSFFFLDLKSVARSPVFTVSPFFLVYHRLRAPVYRARYNTRHRRSPPPRKSVSLSLFLFEIVIVLNYIVGMKGGGGCWGEKDRADRFCFILSRFACVREARSVSLRRIKLSRKGCWVYERWLIAPFTLPRDFMAERRTIEKSVETERSA